MEGKKQVIFIGRSTIDHTYLVDHYPAENTKMFAREYLKQFGGPALNAAITCFLLSGKSTIISCFGNGKTMQDAKENLKRKFDIQILDISENEDYQLPESSIFVNRSNSSRTIINAPRHKNDENFSLEKITIPDSSIILLDGYLFSDELKLKLNIARENGCTVVLDGGSWKPNTESMLEVVDIAICSKDFSYPKEDRSYTIRFMKNKGVKNIAFTNDENDIQLYNGENPMKIPVKKVEAIDTLGAGDVLHGAFCYYISYDFNISKALEKAAIIASNSCKYFDTHTWFENE